MRSRCHRQFDQTQISRHRMEIVVIVQQWPAVLDTPGTDQQIDGLADTDAATAQGTEIARRCDGNRVAGHWHNFETAQQGLDFPSRPLAGKALQHLAKHQIPHDNFVDAEDRAQSPDMRRIPAIQKVDPDATVDNNHPVPRPFRLRARLPRQRYLPNAVSASCCRRSLIIKRSACSTVCFLVACPEAFWASAINASSISILVRIAGSAGMCIDKYYNTHCLVAIAGTVHASLDVPLSRSCEPI